MKFKIKYLVGKDLREKNIFAKSLDDAEIVANKKVKNWQDIIIINKKDN